MTFGIFYFLNLCVKKCPTRLLRRLRIDIYKMFLWRSKILWSLEVTKLLNRIYQCHFLVRCRAKILAAFALNETEDDCVSLSGIRRRYTLYCIKFIFFIININNCSVGTTLIGRGGGGLILFTFLVSLIELINNSILKFVEFRVFCFRHSECSNNTIFIKINIINILSNVWIVIFTYIYFYIYFK